MRTGAVLTGAASVRKPVGHAAKQVIAFVAAAFDRAAVPIEIPPVSQAIGPSMPGCQGGAGDIYNHTNPTYQSYSCYTC